MQRLLDFDVVIEPLGGGYRTRVIKSPTGEAHVDFVLPFTDEDVEILVLKVIQSVGRVRRKVRRIGSQERRLLETFGGQLFQAVFGGDVRECLARSLLAAESKGAGLRIRLRLPGPLANVPWEYLYDGEYGFLGLSPETALVRYVEVPKPVQPLPISPPLRILAMISAPSDVPELQGEEEWDKLNGALDGLVRRGMVEVDRLEAGTLSALQQPLRLREYHVLHFVGHGGYDEDAQDGALALEGADGTTRLVTGRDLGMMVRGHRSLRLIVLNACEGARSARDDPFAGVAQALVRQGIPAVIAMQFEISDRAALLFSQSFYQAIADGLPVDVAMVEARRAMFADGSEVEWATPVLYLRSPDGRVFTKGRVSDAGRRAREVEAERRAREVEAERQAREVEAERRAREAEAERQAREVEAERLAGEEAERQAREAEAERQAREAETERQAREAEAERQAREVEAERLAGEEAERQAREAEAERQAREAEAERQAREAEAERQAREAEAERLAGEEAERQAREAEAERRARAVEAERRAGEVEAERFAGEEAERQAREVEAERRAGEQAERQAREADADRQARRRRRVAWVRVAVAGLASVAVILALAAILWPRGGDNPTRRLSPSPTPTLALEPGVWRQRADLDVRLEAAGTAAYGGSLWVVSGQSAAEGRPALDVVRIYDPTSNSWRDGPRLPVALDHAAVATDGVHLYVVGGETGVGDGKHVRGEVYRLDRPDDPTWANIAPLPDPRAAGAVAWDGSRLVFAGGFGPKGRAAHSEVWAFDGERWKLIGKLHRAREHLAVATNGKGIVWFLGGYDHYATKPFDSVDAVSGDTVERVTSFSIPKIRAAAAVWLPDLGVCLFGGATPSVTDRVQCQRKAPPPLPNLLSPRAGVGAAVLDGTVYVVGGFGGPDVGLSRMDALQVYR